MLIPIAKSIEVKFRPKDKTLGFSINLIELLEREIPKQLKGYHLRYEYSGWFCIFQYQTSIEEYSYNPSASIKIEDIDRIKTFLGSCCNNMELDFDESIEGFGVGIDTLKVIPDRVLSQREIDKLFDSYC